MPLPRFRIRTLMIAVAVVGVDSAYVALAFGESQTANCGNPMFEAFALNVLAVYAYAVWVCLRRIGGSR